MVPIYLINEITTYIVSLVDQQNNEMELQTIQTILKPYTERIHKSKHIAS